MRNHIVMDEFHLTFFVPRGLSVAVYERIHQALTSAHFKTEFAAPFVRLLAGTRN